MGNSHGPLFVFSDDLNAFVLLDLLTILFLHFYI